MLPIFPRFLPAARVSHGVTILLLATAAITAQAQVPQPAAPTLAARSWILYDFNSEQTLSAEKADEPQEPASITKLMTAYITFAALKAKSISLDQNVQVSKRAWQMVKSGSAMFIEPNKPVTVRELIQGMIVQSGNDACVALAELISGSEEQFVARMNAEAKRLGMTGTQYKNVTGLTEAGHYTTARDIAKLVGAIIHDFPEGYKYYSQKEFTYNNIRQPNRNRLLWLDPTVDGVKTGHTDAAGWCLASSAQRSGHRLISVVLGTRSDDARAQESQKLLNFGFTAYDAVKLYAAGSTITQIPVWKGTQKMAAAGFANDLILSVPKGMGDKFQAQYVSTQPLIAPIKKGQKIATLKLSLNGQPYAEYPLVAIQDTPLTGFFGRLWDSIRLWFKSL